MSESIKTICQNNQRINWIDIAKAIAIISVATTHISFFIGNIDQLLSLFCLPLFFIIAGYLFDYSKYKNKFKLFIKNTTKRLLIPGYLSFVILHPFCSFADIKIALYAVGKSLPQWGIGGMSWGLWFFFCLYILKIILFGFVEFTKKFKTPIFLNLLFCCCISLVGTKIGRILPLPWSADIALVALYFAYWGFLIKEFKILENKKLILPITIICIIIGYFDFHYGLFKMNNRGYSNYPLLSINGAVALSILIMYLSRIIANLKSLPTYSKFLQYIGANSIVILFTHILINVFNNIPLLGLICDILGALIIVEILNLIPLTRECYQIKSITTFFPSINNYIQLTKNIFTRFKITS